MKLKTFLNAVALTAAAMMLAGCGKEYYYFAHEEAQAQTGLSWENYGKIQGGRIAKEGSWKHVKGVYSKKLLEGTSNTKCPAGLRVTRSERGWMYVAEDELKAKYNREEIEDCIVIILKTLPKIYEVEMQREQARKEREAQKRQEFLDRKASWKKKESI